jgi:hypothetical protein
LSGRKCEIAISREGAPTSPWFKEENPKFFYFPLYLSPNLAKSSCEDRQLTYFTNLRKKTLSVEYKRNMVCIYNFTLPGKIRTKVLPLSTLAGLKEPPLVPLIFNKRYVLQNSPNIVRSTDDSDCGHEK